MFHLRPWSRGTGNQIDDHHLLDDDRATWREDDMPPPRSPSSSSSEDLSMSDDDERLQHEQYPPTEREAAALLSLLRQEHDVPCVAAPQVPPAHEGFPPPQELEDFADFFEGFNFDRDVAGGDDPLRGSTTRQPPMPRPVPLLPAPVPSIKNAQHCRPVLPPIEHLSPRKNTQKPPILHSKYFCAADVQELQRKKKVLQHKVVKKELQHKVTLKSEDPSLRVKQGHVESSGAAPMDGKKGEKHLLENIDRSGYRHSHRGTKQRRLVEAAKRKTYAKTLHPIAGRSVVVTSPAMKTNLSVTTKASMGRRGPPVNKVLRIEASKASTVAALVSAATAIPASSKIMPVVAEQAIAKSPAVKKAQTMAATAMDAPAGARAAAAAAEVAAVAAPSLLEKIRACCKIEGCSNRAQKGGCCVKHGGKLSKPTCTYEGCTNRVINNRLCTKHGARRRICNHPGCNNVVVKEGVCVRHGAKQCRKICRHEGCNNMVVRHGVCVRHGSNNLKKGPSSNNFQ